MISILVLSFNISMTWGIFWKCSGARFRGVKWGEILLPFSNPPSYELRVIQTYHKLWKNHILPCLCARYDRRAQKGIFKGCFFHEKTSLSSLLVLIVHILSFQNLEASVCASLCIIVKICVISRKVEIILKIMENQCFCFPWA